ncbi:glycogen synthase GlgA [Oscillibacter valericigenes]|uniref:glycogen synthase GlgA n=1 Tax=Oscillibacter valericigenes TaxID=351091 RepID=UPI00195EA232|nr:glycogen synthase GlgA [Oscillibacter valericigenes]MBM6910163.1 glycogen synthase GlgA [Oscillibacter valericigenes]
MKILYAASEAVPFCKTGGLADVAGSLPEALAAQGAEVAVVLPLYQKVRERFGSQLTFECYDYVDLAWRHSYCGLFSLEKDGVTWYFLDNEQYFNRPELYGYMDDGERFGFFSRAVVRMLPHFRFWPDVLHCNDWQTALVPIYLKDDGVREERFRSIRTVLSIHNIEYQGRYGRQTLGDLFGLDHGWADDGTILMDGDVNLLKGAILCADAVNAVSPTYANELKMPYFAHRLDGIMRRCGYKLSGVLNGIDVKRYDPATDSHIAANYTAEDMAGKQADKAELQKLMGLRQEPYVPIVGIVSRLVSHKGLDLVCEVLHDMMELPLQLVILGKGDRKYEEFFQWAANQYPGRMAVRLDYNEELSMAIYAGADLFLMPSRSEPCGLSQMIAMRYGTVPIVRETGGLKDTVTPYEAWRDSGNGFTFANYASSDMLYVIREAVYLYKDYPDAFARLRARAMACDFSWARSAGEYLHIYSAVTGQPWPPAGEPAPANEAAPAEEPVPAEETAPAAEPPDAEEAAPEEASPAQAPAEVPAEAAAPAQAPAREPAPAEAPADAPEKKPAAGKRTAARKTAAKKPAAKKTAAKTGRKTPAKKQTTPKKGTAGKEDPAE